MFPKGLNQCYDPAVERRRAAEVERKARIFNTRQRVMGVDLQALNQQALEKRYRENMEKLMDRDFDTVRRMQDEALLEQDQNEKDRRKAVHQGLSDYWNIQQFDPSYAELKSVPKGTDGHSVPGCQFGVSSMQVFQGEDSGWKERMWIQKKETERNLRNQMDENERKRMNEKCKDLQAEQLVMLQDREGIDRATREEEGKRRSCIGLSIYNQALAAEQADNREYLRKMEEGDNLAEISHTMSSDMMTECPEAAEKEMGYGRPSQILTDRWKGMTPEQLRTIYKAQAQQRIDKQRQHEAEKIENTAWEFQILNYSENAVEEDRKIADLRRKQRIEMDKTNIELANEQQEHQEFLEKQLYTNKPTKDYFNQFNTSSR